LDLRSNCTLVAGGVTTRLSGKDRRDLLPSFRSSRERVLNDDRAVR
jgi:hypothetical protein